MTLPTTTLQLSRLLVAWLFVALVGCARETDAWLEDVDAPEAFSRTLAALALGEAPDADHREAVVALLPLRADEPAVRQPALQSLRRLAGRSPEVFVALLQDPGYGAHRSCLLDSLVGAGDGVVPVLLAALEDAPAGQGTPFAVALGRLDQMSHPAMSAWVEQGSVDQLAAAVAGFDAADRGRAAAHVAASIVDRYDGEPAQRQRALRAVEAVARDSKLGVMGVLSASRSRSPKDQQALTRALFAGLLEGLRGGQRARVDGDQLVDALGARAIPYLVAALASDDERSVKQWASGRLGTFGRPALDALLVSEVSDGWLDEVLQAMGAQAEGWLRDIRRSGRGDVAERAARAERRLSER